MLLYLRGPLGFSEETTALLYALLLVGAIVGPLLAGWLSDRYGRRPILIAYYGICAVGILAFLAAGSNLVLLVPLLLPFGTAVFSESPVLQAFLADRAIGPLRDVAFAVYFTAAFGVGAAWAWIIGQVVQHVSYPAAFGVMAASYLGAAVLVSLVRGSPPAPSGETVAPSTSG
jgi:MFS family permease